MNPSKYGLNYPAIKKKDIKVNCDGESIEIKGEVKFPWGSEDTLNLQLRLTSHVSRKEVKAELTDGILYIVLPKVPEDRPHSVTIK